ncbi:MAG: class I SAM-dependent methyltransferase [Thermoleophilia bacterium]|nr:class I SAM-dependent methyltransferase [Thermoleophilia bacterium]
MSEPQDRPLERTRLESADLGAAWERNAESWLAWARTPGHDSYWLFHRDLFLQLLPPPGRRTLDLGCGEGRLSRDLKALGHDVVGVDAAETLLAAGRTADPALQLHVADATTLPFGDASFDLVVAFMSLQDMEDLRGAVREAARVLERGGRFCLAIVHPFNSAGRFQGDEPTSHFVVEGSHLAESYYADSLVRGGLEMEFVSAHRPLEAYAEALADAGFLVERLREPSLPDHAIQRPRGRRWQRLPLFLHVRALKR